MFSGIISYRGRIESAESIAGGGVRMCIQCEGVQEARPAVKDSIAINGVCLTVTLIDGDRVCFDIVPETLERTALGALTTNENVNVEYSLKLGDAIGGHFVYGHVDTTAKILAITPEGQGVRMKIERPSALAPMLPEKAFVAIDGVSVTIAGASNVSTDPSFELAVIPETLARTTLGERSVGDCVNVEVDPIARYVHASLQK